MALLVLLTLGFFLWSVYYGFFTAKEVIIHNVIDEEEYTKDRYSYQFRDCRNNWRYEDRIQMINGKKTYSGEVIINDTKEALQEICEKTVRKDAAFNRSIDFQNNFAKYALAALFFSILCSMFYYKTRKIYSWLK